MNTTQVSVDLAKSVFQVAVSHTPERAHRERPLEGRLPAILRRPRARPGMDGGVRHRAPLGPRAPGHGSPRRASSGSRSRSGAGDRGAHGDRAGRL